MELHDGTALAGPPFEGFSVPFAIFAGTCTFFELFSVVLIVLFFIVIDRLRELHFLDSRYRTRFVSLLLHNCGIALANFITNCGLKFAAIGFITDEWALKVLYGSSLFCFAINTGGELAIAIQRVLMLADERKYTAWRPPTWIVDADIISSWIVGIFSAVVLLPLQIFTTPTNGIWLIHFRYEVELGMRIAGPVIIIFAMLVQLACFGFIFYIISKRLSRSGNTSGSWNTRESRNIITSLSLAFIANFLLLGSQIVRLYDNEETAIFSYIFFIGSPSSSLVDLPLIVLLSSYYRAWFRAALCGDSLRRENRAKEEAHALLRRRTPAPPSRHLEEKPVLFEETKHEDEAGPSKLWTEDELLEETML